MVEQHPDDDQLKELMRLDLEAARATPQVQHLNSCEHCQARLDTLLNRDLDQAVEVHFAQVLAGVGPVNNWPGTGAALPNGPGLFPKKGPDSPDAVLPGPLPLLSGGGLPVIPGFEIVKELGRGGMGVVYLARQVDLGRLVALKMILAGEYADEAELERFRREAKAIAAVAHPGIVQVFEFGTHGGLPFFALEYCAGGNLANKLASNPLPAPESAGLVEQIARAVQAAHDKGIVHRDLKPGNILLGEDGLPRVTDFGLARQVAGGSGLTQAGAVVGTPSYMAPEQARGDSKKVGPAADVYALGAILYECLTGRPPFQADTPTDTIIKVLTDEPRPPHDFRPGVPRDLEVIALCCLRKDPAGRYASAGALADDLLRFLDGKPVKQRRPWFQVALKPAGVLLLLLAVTCLAGFLMRSRESASGGAPPAYLAGRPLFNEFPLEVTLVGGQRAPGSDGFLLRNGQTFSLDINLATDAYLEIWYVEEDGKLIEFLPNAYRKDAKFEKGKHRVPAQQDKYDFQASASRGPEYIHVIASSDRLVPIEGSAGTFRLLETREHKTQWHQTRGGKVVPRSTVVKVSEAFVRIVQVK